MLGIITAKNDKMQVELNLFGIENEKHNYSHHSYWKTVEVSSRQVYETRIMSEH